jgi:hypothetical protein
MKVKQVFLTAMIAIFVITGCNNGQQGQTQYDYWVCETGKHAGAEIIFAREENVFRGEYIDPGFQEFLSIPIMGTIDSEGNINGVSAMTSEGTIFGTITGKITGNKFNAVWQPVGLDLDIYERREMKMTLKELAPEIEKELANYGEDSFYNFLFPELTLVAYPSGVPKTRWIRFFPSNSLMKDGQFYGYRIGEWEAKFITIEEGKTDREVDFVLFLETNGKYTVKEEIHGTAPLVNGNRFRYKEKGYEFEVDIYTDFAVIRTIAGDLNGWKADGVYPAGGDMSMYVNEEHVAEYDDTETPFGYEGFEQANEFLAYVKLAPRQIDDQLRILFDEVLWIDGDDTETLKKYGLTSDDVWNDYAIYNEKEEWGNVSTVPETKYEVQYDLQGRQKFHEMCLSDFKKYMNKRDNDPILAKVAVLDGVILYIKEVYIP